ncbi:MAG: hypothetical protein LBM98_00985 [Oscillospiraceae bacterium]|nr:hypothetical protein [Oscillospiraceae bacterium]
MDTLPNYENAVVPLDKLLKYSLDYSNPKSRDKAIAFNSALGFTTTNYQILLTLVLKNLPLHRAVFRGSNAYGDRYQVIMTINGVNGKHAEVLTAWIIRYDEDFPRLTNIYVTNKKGEPL